MAVDFSKYATKITGGATAAPAGVDFSKYGAPVAPGDQPVAAPPQKNVFRKVADFFTGSSQALGTTLGTAAASGYANNLQEQQAAQQTAIEEAARRRIADPNLSTDKKQKIIETLQANRPNSIISNNENFNKTGEQVAGEALGTIGEIASFGTLGEASKAIEGGIAARKSIGALAKQGAKEGLKYGTVFGAQKGASDSLQRNERAADVIKNTAVGAGVGAASGAAFGAAIPAAFGAVGDRAATRAAQRAKNVAMLEKGVPDAAVATKEISPAGKLRTDKVAKEVVRQGVPEADVALIKGGSAADKAKMAKMLDVRASQMTNKRVTARATDVVGDTFIEKIAKPLQKTNREAAASLDEVAKGLQGQKVDATPPLTQLSADLDAAGVKVRANGTLNFRNSDFEGITTAQTALKNVWNRAQRVAKSGDALALHRSKRFVDEVVDYGKAAEGLSGRAQNILKKFRHNADAVLDAQFPAYNQANTVYADTIGELHKIGEAMGRSFKIGDNFADARAGQVMRRILSNTKSRSDVLQLLESAQGVARKYGAKIDEDVITQANFADILERMIGSEAPTSFLGQMERAVEPVASAGAEFARGNVIKGTIKAGKYALDVTRGITQENKIKALRALVKTRAGIGRP